MKSLGSQTGGLIEGGLNGGRKLNRGNTEF